MIRAGRRAPQHKMPGGKPTQKVQAQVYTFTSPRRGWSQSEDKMNPAPGAALVLDNFFPTTSGIRARGGSYLYATLAGAAKSLFTYRSGGTEQFFAGTPSRIYDITAVSDPTATPTVAVGGLTSGDWITEHFGTTAGEYLYCVNGADSARLYDGSTWQAVTDVSSPISITGVSTASLNFVWAYANRLFFIENSSMSVWYLPVSSLGGAATELNLSGVFSRGGYLVAGGVWSVDAGDGLGEKCIFISSEGEIAVYQGTDPASALTWSKIGLYSLTKPLGKRAMVRAGGDVLIATQAGLLPLSVALATDGSALGSAAASRPIAQYWADKSLALIDEWRALKLPAQSALLLTQPGDRSVLLMNMTTGAWCRYTGWDARAVGIYKDIGYFADNTGKVFIMEEGGSDNGTAYTCRFLGWHETLGSYGTEKMLGQARYAFNTSVSLKPKLSMLTDFDVTASTAPDSATSGDPPMWNTTAWDTAYWDGGEPQVSLSHWQSVGRSGYAVAPEMQLTFNIPLTPDVEMMTIDMTYNLGAVVT